MKKRINLKSVLAISFLAIAGLFGVTSVVLNKQAEETPVVEKAKADNTKHFFLDCSSLAGWDSESVCIHTWNGSSDVYKEATKVTDNYWYVVIDTTGCEGYRWYRCEAGNTGKRWNESGWNSTISNNYCSIKGWDTNATFSGSTDGCEESYEVASTTPTTSTKRVWVDPKGTFYSSNARAALRVFNGDTHYKTYVLGGSSQYESVGDEAYIFYVDIPVSYDCQLVRLHNAFDFVWSYGHNISSMDGYNTTKIVYQWTDNISSDYSCSNESSPTVSYAKKVLDGYSTCLSSSVNGYGAYSNIKTNILDKLSASDLSTLQSSTFTASGYGTRTYGEKMTRMSHNGALSAIHNFSPLSLFGDGEDNLSTLIVIVASSVALLSVTALSILVLKKRKHKEQ